MEGHKQKGARLLCSAGSALDDGVSPESGGGDLLKHAACGVHDKHQSWSLPHAEEPVSGRFSLIHTVVLRELRWAFVAFHRISLNLLEEGLGAHSVFKISQGSLGSYGSQTCSFHMEVMVRGEEK